MNNSSIINPVLPKGCVANRVGRVWFGVWLWYGREGPNLGFGKQAYCGYHSEYPQGIFQQVKEMYPRGTTEEALQINTFKDEWAKWDDEERRQFHGRWRYTVATSPLLVTEHLRSPFRVEFSGLGGSHVLEEPFVADLFVKCMPSAPCYGPSLAYVDRKETDTMWATSIGRTAQTHEYHTLHEAAWPIGVFAWQRIVCQWNQSLLPALEPGILMTRACSLAAMGSKCPAHQRDPHPGHQNAMRLFMMALQPAQTAHYVKQVLIPACPGPIGALSRPFGLELNVTVEVHAIGHSAGSYGAMVFFLLAGQLVHVTWSCWFIIGWWEVKNLYKILELGRSPLCIVKRETSWWKLRQITEDIHQLQQDTPAHNELRAPMYYDKKDLDHGRKATAKTNKQGRGPPGTQAPPGQVPGDTAKEQAAKPQHDPIFNSKTIYTQLPHAVTCCSRLKMAKFYRQMHKWNSTPVLSLIRGLMEQWYLLPSWRSLPFHKQSAVPR